jgi:hypothetical protein
MRNNPENFIEREQGEPLALHLYRNADVIGCDVSQRRRLRHAAALCVRGHQAPHSATVEGRQDRIDAGRIADAVNRELRAGMDEIVDNARAEAGGADATTYNDAGALRLGSRDGLWTAQQAEDIDDDQAATGLAYRLVFEIVGASQLGSQLGRVNEASIKASSSDGAAARGLFRAYAGVRLTTAEALVLKADPTQRALRVLRAVAGEGRSLRSMGRGNSLDLNKRALKAALDAARPVLIVEPRRLPPCESGTG